MAVTAPAASALTPVLTPGMDMASYAGTPSAATWTTYASKYKFVFIKATEGTYYSPSSSGAKFNAQWAGATTAGMLRGAYHFANPRDSGGIAQADFFVAHGGAWTADGHTLPGVLDIEYDPYSGNMCFGLSQGQMITWINAFNTEYYAKEGVYPIIYSTTGWWTTCTGNSSAFSKTNAFWLASINGSTTSGPSSLTAGTGNWTFWQYGQQSSIDVNQFNGPLSLLQQYAAGSFPVGSHFPSGAAAGMGQPIGPETAATAFGVTGYYQSFSGGRGLITSPSGTFASSGAIYSAWSPLTSGWPTSAITAVTADGVSGYQQNFTAGATASRAFWTAQHPVPIWMSGNLLAHYDALGGTPAIGWPASAVVTSTAFGATGSYLRVQSGQELVTTKYGTFALPAAAATAWSPSTFGWPTQNAQTISAANGRGVAGSQQSFVGPTGGARAFWTASNPSAIWLAGSLLSLYNSSGGTPALGWPVTKVSAQTAFGVAGSSVKLQSGQGLITSKYGSFTSNAGIFATWAPTRYGWPTGAPYAVNTHGIAGYQQNFAEGGTAPNVRAFWNPATPTTALWLSGSILGHYNALGGTTVLGWPISVMTSQTAFKIVGWTQRFQSGRAFIASTYGVYDSNGSIYGSWRAALYGWPTTDLQRTVLHGQAGWIERFRKGSSGVDYAFASAVTGKTTWTNGTP